MVAPRPRGVAAVVLALVLPACSIPSASPSPSPSPEPTARTTVIRVLVTEVGAGTPLAGARVCASRPSSTAPRCTVTAGDGVAALEAAPGTYFIRVSGRAEERWSDVTRVADLATTTPVALWVELRQLRRISGRVFDEDGAPAPNAVACAHATVDDRSECATSGPDGAYAIDVPPEVYRLQVSGGPGARLVTQWARGRAFPEEADRIDVRSGDVPGLDVTLVRGVTLSGTVTLADEPVEDAQVCLRTLAAPLPWECERTDERGRYHALREPGTYYVWFIPPPDVRAIPQWFGGALTGAGTTALVLYRDRTVDVALSSGPEVRGAVRTTNGDPVAGAFVCIDTAFATGRICRETDRSGRYAIATRPATYVVSVIAPEHSGLMGGYWSGKRTWNDADEVVVGRDDVMLDLTLASGHTVTGIVRDARGVPIAGAYVNFADDRGVAAATSTDISGRFEVVVAEGTFAVEVFPPLPLVGLLVSRRLTADAPHADHLAITLDDVAP